MTGIEFSRSAQPAGLRIHDPIQNAEVYLLTRDEFDIVETDPEFLVPVDDVVRLDGFDGFRIPYFVEVYLRTPDGSLVDQLSEGGELTATGRRYVEFGGLNSKVYLRVEGPVTVTEAGDSVEVDLTDCTVAVGARSFHEEPRATITATRDVESLVGALNALSSSLKTLSSERAYPTLRGHPPLVELGDEHDVPAELSPPSTDVRIVVPPELDSVFPVASLNFYTAGTIETGRDSRFVVGDETYDLPSGEGLADRASELLRQVFLFDCVTRTEGLYQLDLHERERLEDRVDVDVASLYGRPIEDRINAYLDVPFEAVADLVPRWKQSADVKPVFGNAPVVPFLANELALVRCPPYTVRSAGQLVSDGGDLATRAAPDTSGDTGQLFRLEGSACVEHIYVGDGVPTTGAKMTPSDFEAKIGREPGTDPTIKIAVVNNETEQMDDESAVTDIYGEREWYQFDIDVFEDCTTEQVRHIFETDTDLLHYIGHIDDAGIRCRDGHLDTRTLDHVGVDMFLLNACNSMSQAQALVENGAIGGMGTFKRIVSKSASEFGISVARLLNQGYSLLQSLEILKREFIVPHRFITFGDGTTSLVHREGRFPLVATIEPHPDGVELTYEAFPMNPPGSIVTPVTDKDTRYVNLGRLNSWVLSEAELERTLSVDMYPVIIAGRQGTRRSFYWSDSIPREELETLLNRN